MSRRGGRGRPNDWSTASPKAPRPRPHGLRGRDIGMFYRNQQMKMKAPREDVTILLTIPPAVITAVENNIKSIKALAKQHDIPIANFKGLNYIKTEIKQEEDDLAGDVHFAHPNIPTYHKKNRSDYSMSSPSCSTSKETTEPVMETNEGATPLNIIENIDKEPQGDTNSMFNETDKKVTEDESDMDIKLSKKFKSEPMDITSSSDMDESDCKLDERLLSLRGGGDFKYGYEDIITGTFEEKLDESLSKGITILRQSTETDDLSLALYEDYQNMINMDDYKRFMQFRQTLPTYKKSEELLDVINNNQVVVISGETGCGKSTQVPQLILDKAILDKRGGYVKILVTQPRRIAASSLAMRVAQERSERVGHSVGYAVRLDSVDARARGSIMFCTTGILLATLEVDQALSNYTHVILDEVHERDCDIDIGLYILKKVLQKRSDLKVILMSATIDADTLSNYFNKCPMIHIEGLAYPVEDVYLEQILQITNYKLPLSNQPKERNVKPWERNKMKKVADDMEKDIQYKAEISPWLESIKKTIRHDVYKTLQDQRIEELNIDLIYDLLVYICKGPPGGILVFLPGISEISKLVRMLQSSARFPVAAYNIYPLHSKLPSLEQHSIFERPKGNVRKIIVATNIAETSITIDDIVYVIDCGRMKYSGLNVEENFSTLQTEWISKANMRQRRGRAGRCQEGICYHLLTSYRAEKLEDRILPEIQRDPLLEPVLAIKKLRLGKAAEALGLMPAPPADTTIQLAIKHLQQCGALDYAEKLTPLGWHMARLPVHPAAGKLLLLGALFGCLNRAASVAAVWGFKDPFQLVIGKEDYIDATKKGFGLGEGSDQVAISEAIIQWENLPSQSQKRDFAFKNFLAYSTLELLSDMKRQFGSSLKSMGFLPSGDITAQWENRNMGSLSLFKALVAAALYPNVVTVKWNNLNARNPRKIVRLKVRRAHGDLYIHPSSVMAAKTPRRGLNNTPACSSPGAQWLVYWRKQQSTKLYLLEVTSVHTLPLLFFGELTVTEGPTPDECYIMVTSVKVRCKRHTAELLFQMKCLLDQVLAKKIGVSSDHATIQNPFEDQVLNAVKELITAEDERAEHLDDDDDHDHSESDQSEQEYSMSGRR